MKKLLTFLFAFLASIGLMNAAQVTLTWALDADLSGTCSEPEITLTDVTYGSNLKATPGKSYQEGSGTLFSPIDAAEKTTPRTDGSGTLTFAFSIPEGYSFKLSNVSFFSSADGSNNNHYLDVYFNSESPFVSKYRLGRGTSLTGTPTDTPAETKSVGLSDVELTGDNTLKIDLYGKPASNTKGWAIGNVVITGDLVNLSDTRENANISWSVPSTTLKIRDAFTAPVLKNDDNLPVTFSSSNEEVAVVDEDGDITLAGGLGTAMISATYDGEAAGAQYQTTTANTTIEVITNVVNAYAWEEYEKVESIPLSKLYTADKTSGSLAVGNLIDDDIINIKTVATAKYTSYRSDFLGNTFPGAVQLGRVSAAPTEDTPTGTIHSDNSPIIVTPKVDCKVVMFIRRQGLEQSTSDNDDVENNVITRTHHIGMSPNDGKSVFAVPHSAIDTKLDQNLVLGAYGSNNATGNDYIFCAIEWDMKAGETYTLYALSTTIAMQGIGYYLESGNYTLRYVADGKTIKEVTKSGVVGTGITLTDEDVAEFTLTEGDAATKYTYDSDDSEGMTISADEVVVVTIKMLGTAAKAPNVLYSWDFTDWSEATVANLKAKTNWSDIESTTASEPTALSENNCFWQVSAKDIDGNKYVMADGKVIEELEGLVYTNTNDRSLAIALNYQEIDLSKDFGPYHGASYLWLGSNKKNYFIIPGVPAGATIKMGVESHKISDPRGVELSIAGEKLNAPNGSAVEVPTTYTEQEWYVPSTAAELNDVQIYNTNGCHIYYITVTHPDLQKYIVRYVADNETIKEVIKVGQPDSPVSLTEEDKADFTVTENGFSTTYSYSSDDATGKTIAADGSTTVTITMLKGMTWPTGWMTVPGELDIAHSSWEKDGLQLEEKDGLKNIGYVKNNTSATTEQVYVTEAGVYSMNIDFYWFKNACDFQVEITDQATSNKEINTYYHISGIHEANILLEGNLTEGKKTIKYTFHSESDDFLVNFRNQTFTKVGETYAALKGITAEGVDAAETEGYDYTFNIPMNYDGETVTLKAELLNATLSVKAGEDDIRVSEDGTFELPVPAPNEESEAVLTLGLEKGAVAGQTEFKLRLFHVDGVMLTGLNIDGLEVAEETVATLQEEKKDVKIDGYIFTTLPTVKATFKDGKVVEATGTPADDKATATYTFTGVAGDKTEDYSFTLSGLHIYQAAENDHTAVLKYDAAYKDNGEDGNWSDGKYSISCNDGWDGKQFKMKSGNPVTLTAPSYMRIKQIKMASLYDNYQPGKVASVTSEGATVYLPSASEFVGKVSAQAIDLVINVENHVEGTPFVITFEGGSEPVAWFEFIYEPIIIDVTGISLDKTEATLVNGEELTLEATVSPEDATDKTVAWSSSNENIATVDSEGNVKAVGIGKATITAKAGEFSATFAVKCYPQKGDATYSGSVIIADAIHIANHVVGKNPVPEGWTEADHKEFYPKAADVNEDGDITISDASATVELALKNNSEPAAKALSLLSLNAPEDNLVIGGLKASANGGSTVAVTLDNTMDYVALQADIYVPEGVNFDVKPGSRIADSHSFQYYRFDESHVRVAIYTFSGNAFADNNEPLFEIVADSSLSDASDISLVKILASDSDANEYVLGSRYAATTGVDSIAGAEENDVWYTLDGVRIERPNAKGIFIHNGKKVVIR